MSLDTPALVMARLQEIEDDLARRQNLLERAARAFYMARRDRERARAEVFLTSEGTVAERSARADQATALNGAQEEAEYEALRAVVRTLDTRSAIGMSLLRAQSRHP